MALALSEEGAARRLNRVSDQIPGRACPEFRHHPGCARNPCRSGSTGPIWRLVAAAASALERIAEFSDADEAECANPFRNPGIQVMLEDVIFDLQPLGTNGNFKGKYYLTGMGHMSGIQACALIRPARQS
ncbi:hypothetical protein KUW17_18055 [Leisingera aquaemixtae]|uniref:hypothetical protein n=1 Tax=Leisingera aquaemixtae TaxID=1396826 RepID=UPI001C971A4E|nr:hypothetical protein [Leisingera aquaemixtae]MBY6068654.1 hypothetical protein [Leisingera aquaemixtae]